MSAAAVQDLVQAETEEKQRLEEQEESDAALARQLTDENPNANGAGGGDNAAVVAAVRALGAKMDTMITKLGNGGDFVMQVNNREFGRVINEHIGEDGFHPIKLRTA